MASRSYALLALVVGAAVTVGTGHLWAGAAVLAVGLAGYVAWGKLRFRLALSRIAKARQAFDGEALRHELDKLERYVNEMSPLYQELGLERGVTYLMEERYDEAAEVLDAVLPARLSERSRVALLGNRAFCALQRGRAAEALALATESTALAEALGPEIHALHLGILGAAHVASGRPEEGLPLLDRALAQADPHPRLRAMRELYRGQALKALGRAEEARAAFAQVVALAPGTVFARRAHDASNPAAQPINDGR